MEIDNISILRLEAGSAEDIRNVLKELVDKNTQRFSFNELNQDNRRQKLWNILFMHLEKQSSAICHKECLAAIRMLSRDKIDLDKLMSENWVDLLLTHAGLAPQEHHLTWYNLSDENYQIMVEAQKALCNLIYNSEKVQSVCEKNKCIEEIVMRLRLFKEPNLPHSIKYFDMRMLFIITALCTSTRDRLKDELHGLTYLMETLDLIMNEAAVAGIEEITLNEERVSLAAEVLKVLFNLMAKESCKPHFDEGDEDALFLRLEIILKNLLLCKTEPKDNIDNLRGHVVNLLTTVPGSCHKELISTVSSNDPPKGMEFEGKNMEAVAILLDFLDKKLSGQKSSENLKSQQDLLSPILTVLIECARSEKVLRRYLRMHILPPLRDVKTRPEEGDKLRNKLCRLLTSSVTNVRDLAAELLFILCKENVARMIKYTGYGNAAGMFANRGLLGQRGQNSDTFSSNSEDSDTEEYTRYKDRINPVVGCYEPPRPDPMASMSDEQKEYEAIKLANMMDKLSREGLVQPCKIGVDGRPEPVEHILELQDDLPKQQIHNDNTDE